MSDLYTITVLARDGGVIDLAVDIVHPDVVDIPLSPSFAAMLIEDEWGPGAAAYKAWWRAWADRDPAADPAPLYQSVELIEVRNLPRVQSEPTPACAGPAPPTTRATPARSPSATPARSAAGNDRHEAADVRPDVPAETPDA